MPRAQNPTSNARDGIVSGGFASELAAVSGSVETGYTALLKIGIQPVRGAASAAGLGGP